MRTLLAALTLTASLLAPAHAARVDLPATAQCGTAQNSAQQLVQRSCRTRCYYVGNTQYCTTDCY